MAANYLHGAENIVPGLERKIQGCAVGQKLDVVLEPAEAYGERNGSPLAVPKDAFPDDTDLAVGMHVVAQNPDGSMIPLWILEVGEDRVVVDPNHPLAGVTLHFSVEVKDIRDATKEEIEHGHPHGADGHDGH